MRVFIIYAFLALTTLSCSSPQLVEKSVFVVQRQLPLTYQATDNIGEEGIAVLLPDVWDSIRFKDSKLLDGLVQKKYKVIIPNKVGPDQLMVRTLDNYTERLNDLTTLLDSLTTVNDANLLIIGFGDAVQLLPTLAKQSKATLSIAINTSPYSFLYELELLSNTDDTTTVAYKRFLKRFSFKSAKDVRTQINQIKDSYNSAYVFARASWLFWRSYLDNPLMSTIDLSLSGNTPMLFILSKQYAFITESSQLMLNNTLEDFGYPTKNIEGYGNFNKEEEMDALSEVVLERISSLR